MNEKMKQALLQSFEIKEKAKSAQTARGHSDQGERTGVTSGKHLDPVAGLIASDLVSVGLDEKDICIGRSNMELPGWFRPTKQWDILAFSEDALVIAIELKSISSSYSKNLNNRAEEALGMAVDAKAAERHGLFTCNVPPLFCYAMIVKADSESRKPANDPKNTHFNNDEIFNGCSYIKRFEIMCHRFLEENIYDAVWFVTVDPENKTVEEPSDDLSYQTFITTIADHFKRFDIYENVPEVF